MEAVFESGTPAELIPGTFGNLLLRIKYRSRSKRIDLEQCRGTRYIILFHSPPLFEDGRNAVPKNSSIN